jgi:hypothetical protein
MEIYFFSGVFETNSRFIGVRCSNKNYLILNGFLNDFKNEEEILDALEKVKYYRNNIVDNPEDIFDNEYSLRVYGEKSIAKITVPGELPTELETDLVIEFITKFLEFFRKIENCEIPGVIPESKLGTWVCVPKEYVKDEFISKIDTRLPKYPIQTYTNTARDGDDDRSL